MKAAKIQIRRAGEAKPRGSEAHGRNRIANLRTHTIIWGEGGRKARATSKKEEELERDHVVERTKFA